MKNILVTGGCGNIGRYVVRYLINEQGCNPIIYDLQGEAYMLEDIADKLTVVQGDVQDLEKLKFVMHQYNVEGVIHLAKLLGASSIAREKDPRQALMVNVVGTANVLEAARIAKVKRIVFSSSRLVYADATGKHGPPQFLPISEDYPKFDREDPGFITFYSLTNKMAEYYGIRYAMRFDMEFVTLRFADTWGPGKLMSQSKESIASGQLGGLLCEIIESALSGKSVILPAGSDEYGELIYYKDLGRSISMALFSDKIKFVANHRDIHLGSGQMVSLGQAIDIIKHQIPNADIRVGAGPLPNSRHKIILFDLSRAREELGYIPMYVDLNAAIADYIDTKQKFR